MKITYTYLILLGAVFTAALTADVKLAPLFQDGVVLQRGKPVPVWGTAEPNEAVTVKFANQEHRAVADADGYWKISLTELKASFEPAVMVITGKNNRLEIADILVGEVWIASGQSNMEWSVRHSQDAALEIAAAHYPAIRQFRAARTVADEPARFVEGRWQPALAGQVDRFSAVGYYFARDLHQILQVPVGIINTSWGGTPIEPWLPPQYLESHDDPILASVHERWSQILENYPAALERYHQSVIDWEKQREAAQHAGEAFTRRPPRPPTGQGHRDTPAGLYNGMIHPLAPYAVAGFIWYQGESNVSRANQYHYLFSRMILGWRDVFSQGDLPFYWVQLANYRRPDQIQWAYLREAQTQTLQLPATGQAIAIDIGDVRDIHPRNKQSVGRRLARLALNRNYNFDIVDSGPVMVSSEREGTGFRIHFNEVHGSLKSPFGELKGFELAGEDQEFHPAEARIEGKSVLVISDAVSEPVAVRYAWYDAPLAGLFNNEGLPAVPFRTDTW